MGSVTNADYLFISDTGPNSIGAFVDIEEELVIKRERRPKQGPQMTAKELAEKMKTAKNPVA